MQQINVFMSVSCAVQFSLPAAYYRFLWWRQLPDAANTLFACLLMHGVDGFLVFRNVPFMTQIMTGGLNIKVALRLYPRGMLSAALNNITLRVSCMSLFGAELLSWWSPQTCVLLMSLALSLEFVVIKNFDDVMVLFTVEDLDMCTLFDIKKVFRNKFAILSSPDSSIYKKY